MSNILLTSSNMAAMTSHATEKYSWEGSSLHVGTHELLRKWKDNGSNVEHFMC
jgi:hypothetical protein